MLVVMLIAGIGLLLAGLLTVGFGIQLDLSLGNTLILTGAIVACTGIVMLGLWTVVRELRGLARLPGPARSESRAGTALQTPGDRTPQDGSFPFSRDQPAPDGTGQAELAGSSPPPWHEEVASRDRGRVDAPAAVAPELPEPAPAVKPRRNLLFSSSSRKERERAEARATEPSDLGAGSVAPPPVAEPSEAPPASFDDAWPKPERARAVDSPPRRGGRAPSTFTEPNAGVAAPDRYPPAARNEPPPAVTVLKSGVVDGMAYSLYSDGSIEAQMPEGMMRFASIDELRSHLDQRP
jgi:hypothetical protein